MEGINHVPMTARFGFCVRILAFSLLSGATGRSAEGESQAAMLWYAQPASKWTEALPIGNGRLGAMVFGGISDERIQFNEDTLWTGHPHDYANTNALKQLPKIRELLACGKNKAAGQLPKKNFLGSPSKPNAYQALGRQRVRCLGD